MDDVSSLRRLYASDNKYYYNVNQRTTLNGVTIECGETHKTTPEFVKFTLGFPLDMLGISSCGNQINMDIMTADYCLRKFAKRIENIYIEKEHNTGKEKYTVKINIYTPGQKIILRNSSYVKNNFVYILLVIRFPILMASKRTVVAEKIPARIVQNALGRAIRDFIKNFDVKDYNAKAAVYKRQQEIRQTLKDKNLISFVANGSILPRDDNGLALYGAVKFMSPPEDEIEINLSDGLILKGMGIKEGVTVITGGGYSGKSTLLDAMLHGIYNHIPGDGREYCITRENSCKIAAEDGRPVTSLDISPFIRNIGGLSTKKFTALHASGSTSQAANIMEAISFGCTVLLIDEDRTATNFMIRDSRMKKIIKDDPIVPFTDRVRQIYKDTGISTILIIGGSGEYLDLADNVYIMKDYLIYNYNKEVTETKQNTFDFFTVKDTKEIKWRLDRTIQKDPMMTFKKDEETNRIRELAAVTDEEIYVGINKANISRLDTIISRQQMTAIAFIIRNLFTGKKDIYLKCRLYEEVKDLYEKISDPNNGLDNIYSTSFGIDFNMELPAMHDIMFTISRMNNIVYIDGDE